MPWNGIAFERENFADEAVKESSSEKDVGCQMWLYGKPYSCAQVTQTEMEKGQFVKR